MRFHRARPDAMREGLERLTAKSRISAFLVLAHVAIAAARFDVLQCVCVCTTRAYSLVRDTQLYTESMYSGREHFAAIVCAIEELIVTWF